MRRSNEGDEGGGGGGDRAVVRVACEGCSSVVPRSRARAADSSRRRRERARTRGGLSWRATSQCPDGVTLQESQLHTQLVRTRIRERRRETRARRARPHIFDLASFSFLSPASFENVGALSYCAHAGAPSVCDQRDEWRANTPCRRARRRARSASQTPLQSRCRTPRGPRRLDTGRNQHIEAVR